MKAKFNISEISGDCLSPGKGSFRSRVSKLLLTLLEGILPDTRSQITVLYKLSIH